MKKIFSLPSISTAMMNSRNKQSEFYSNDVGNLMDYSNSSIDLTDDKRIKLEQLQNRLSVLYEELDKVMIKEEELTVLNYRNKKRKIEPVSNFISSIDSLTKFSRSKNSSKSSSSKSLCSDNLENNYENKHDNHENDFQKDQLDCNSNYNDLTGQHEVKEMVFSNFYFSLSESNLSDEDNIEQNGKRIDQSNQIDREIDPEFDKEFVEELIEELSKQSENELKFRKKLKHSKSLNGKMMNSPIDEQDENLTSSVINSTTEQSNILNRKVNFLKQKLSNVINENTELKSKLQKTIESEQEIKQNCKRMEEKILNQKDKIEQLQNRLTESISNHNKLKVEHEQFKIEMQIEREKFTNFVLEESKFDKRTTDKQLQRKLKEKDQFITKLVNEIDNLKLNFKNKSLNIDFVEKNKLVSSQIINLDQNIQNISIYQTNNVPELLMINLDDNSNHFVNNHLNSTPLNSCHNQSNLKMTDDKSNQSMSQSVVNNRSINETVNTNNQTIDRSIDSVKHFCHQINCLQKEFSLIVDEEKKRNFMIKIEDFVLKNMRKLVIDKMDSFFDTLQLYLAQLKFDIIQFAVERENEQRRSKTNTQSNYLNSSSKSSIEWFKLMTSNLTNTNLSRNNLNKKQQSKNFFIDHNNNIFNQQQINKQTSLRNRNLRNNSQSRTVERRMIELRRSIETYLKSYLVRILLEMQDQTN